MNCKRMLSSFAAALVLSAAPALAEDAGPPRSASPRVPVQPGRIEAAARHCDAIERKPDSEPAALAQCEKFRTALQEMLTENKQIVAWCESQVRRKSGSTEFSAYAVATGVRMFGSARERFEFARCMTESGVDVVREGAK
jgi:hypothetical protein